MKKCLVGVDEAGRGPLAGPVAVGLAKVPYDFDWRLVPGVTDSKQLSERARELIYQEAVRLRRAGALDWRVVMPGAQQIDQRGISAVIKASIAVGLKRLAADPRQTAVRLDGLLKAPAQFADQKTIIKGDQKERVIGLASIVAKVTRDRYMLRQATKKPYQLYGFATHKGYGTKAHIAAIKQHGLSDIHRKTYCLNLSN